MKYDFTSIMDRHGKDAIAIDGLGTAPIYAGRSKGGFDAIPMWVADMNFPHRAHHPGSHYRAGETSGFRLLFPPTDAYFDSIIRWQERRNG